MMSYSHYIRHACGTPHAAILILALLLPFMLTPQRALAQQPSICSLQWITEEYYPYNFTENGYISGISTEMLRLTWKELQEPEHTITSYPWARAYRMAQTQPGTVLFSMARTPQREQMFKWAGPIAHVRFALTALKSRNLTVNSGEDLAGLRIGTLRDDVGDQLLNPWREISTIEPVPSMKQNLKKLNLGRLDLISYEENSTRLYLLRHGKRIDDYETVFVLEEVPIYYAFHKDTPDELVQRFQQALDRVKEHTNLPILVDEYVH